MQFILHQTRAISSFQNDKGGYFPLLAKLLQLVASLGGWVGVLMSVLLAWVWCGEGRELGRSYIALVICSRPPFIQQALSACLLEMTVARGEERVHGMQITPEFSHAQNGRPRTHFHFPFWLWPLPTSLCPLLE